MKAPVLFVGFFAALVMSLAPARAGAPGWRGILFGSSKAEVQEVLPGGKWDGEVYGFSDFELQTGDSVDVRRWKWQLMLQFAGGRFVRAILQHAANEKNESLVYEAMEWRAALAKAYGETALDDGTKDKRTTVWREESLCVSLEWMRHAGLGAEVVTLVYEQPPYGL